MSVARRWLSSVSGARGSGVAERSLVSERRVVDHASDDPVSVPDLGQAAPRAGRRRRQRLPLAIDPAARAAVDDLQRRVLERVRQRAPQLLGRQRAPQPSREPTQRRAHVHPPAHQADQERHGHDGNGERDQPHRAVHERRPRPRLAHAQGDAEHQGPHDRDGENRRERPTAQPGRTTDAVGEPSDDRHEEPDRDQRARRAHELLDDPRLSRHGHERVARTVRTATHPRGRRRVGLHEQRRREVQQRDEQHGRRRQRPIDAVREATGRERQDQVDQPRLDSPVHHAPGAVGHRVVGQRERDHQDRRAHGHQEPPETLERRASPRQQAHRHRDPDRDRSRGGLENHRRRRRCRRQERGPTPPRPRPPRRFQRSAQEQSIGASAAS